jgi:hypothetical protein
MAQQDRSRKRDPSDLTDEHWAIVAPLSPSPQSSPRGGHPRTVDMREVLHKAPCGRTLGTSTLASGTGSLRG